MKNNRMCMVLSFIVLWGGGVEDEETQRCGYCFFVCF